MFCGRFAWYEDSDMQCFEPAGVGDVVATRAQWWNAPVAPLLARQEFGQKMGARPLTLGLHRSAYDNTFISKSTTFSPTIRRQNGATGVSAGPDRLASLLRHMGSAHHHRDDPEWRPIRSLLQRR